MTKYDDAWVAREEAKRAMMAEQGLYSPEEEHSSCGVGLVVNIDGSRSRSVVENGIKALKAIWHRGAVDADGVAHTLRALVLYNVPFKRIRQYVSARAFWTVTITFATIVYPLFVKDFITEENNFVSKNSLKATIRTAPMTGPAIVPLPPIMHISTMFTEIRITKKILGRI